jgi:hypothetical protein
MLRTCMGIAQSATVTSARIRSQTSETPAAFPNSSPGWRCNSDPWTGSIGALDGVRVTRWGNTFATEAQFLTSAADWISEICVARTVDRPPNRQTLYASFATFGVGTTAILTVAPNGGQGRCR